MEKGRVKLTPLAKDRLSVFGAGQKRGDDMQSENEYMQVRRNKIRDLRMRGINPYPNNIKPKDTVSEIRRSFDEMKGEELESLNRIFSIAGRIMAIRLFGKAAFLKVADRTGTLQVFVEKNSISEDEFETFKMFDVGDFGYFEGGLFRTKTGELTLRATHLKFVAKAIRLLPEKWHGLTDVETRYRQRYLDLIVNPSVKETFIKRAKIIAELRQYLVEKDFIEVETPMMHPIPGGACARPFVTHHNALDMDLYMRIAPELYLKRLVVGGFERVFEINRNFRNEGISIQHNPEFTMLEFYMSYATYEDLMDMTEDMLKQVVEKVCGKTEVEYQGVKINFAGPYPRYTMKEALIKIGNVPEKALTSLEEAKKYATDIGIQLKPQDTSLGHIIVRLFEEIVEAKLIQPTFIIEFPIEASPLSRRNDKDPSIADRFELFIYGREIANAFSELNDPEDQEARFREQALAKMKGDDEAMYFDSDYIRALEYGMPPTAGEGIGIDRLVMLLTNSASIRDVILFPHLRQKEDLDK